MSWSYYGNCEKTAQPIIDRLAGQCKWNHGEEFAHHLSTISRCLRYSFNCNVFLYPMNQYNEMVFKHIYKTNKKPYITKNYITLVSVCINYIGIKLSCQ